MRSLPELPAGRCGVVTLAELHAAGWTDEAVRHAVRSGRLERVAAGRFAPPPSPDLDEHRRADLRLLRRAVAATLPDDRVAVASLAAALHRGWPVWADDPRPCVTTWSTTIRRVAGLHLHRDLDTSTLVRRAGTPVSSAARTIVEVACEFGTEAALVPGDVALRERALTLDALAAEVERAAGRPGIAHARRVADLLDPRSESPLESRSRWHFDVHGIAQPISQAWIFRVDGRFLGRVDHLWPEGAVGEADGTRKYRDPKEPDALAREKRRQQGFEDVDLEVARWGAVDLRDFTAAAARVERARVRARRRLTEGGLQWYALDSDGVRVPVPGVGTR